MFVELDTASESSSPSILGMTQQANKQSGLVEIAMDTSSSSPTNSSTVTTEFSDNELFTRHRVTKYDTLAGLAVKYNVSVADIKQANGFLSDTAMFARESILIPTRAFNSGPEYAWSGMMFAHLNKIPARRSVPHNSAAVQRLRGYYSTGPSPFDMSPLNSDDEDEHAADHEVLRAMTRNGSRRNQKLPGEVELMTRGPSAAPSSSGRSPYLRRREAKIDGDYAEMDMQPSSLPSSPTSMNNLNNNNNLNNRPGLFHSQSSPLDAAAASLQPTFKEFQRRSVKWKDNVLAKIKRVASQPVLATGQMPSSSMSKAADAVIGSFSRSASNIGGGSGGPSSIQQVMYQATKMPQKECRKAD